MNTAPVSTSTSKNATASKQIRGPEIGPALKRDIFLQRVRAARKRLTSASDGFARVR